MTGPTFRVLAPGLQSTIQDLGRPGFGHLGVPPSGAADPWSLAVANRLVDNPDTAAALEITLVGPDLAVLRPAVVAVAGADLGATIVVGGTSRGVRPGPGGAALRPGMTATLDAGDQLAFRSATSPDGARAYLAVRGGFDVPIVLTARSTCLPGAFGGLDGRALATGDDLAAFDGPARGDDGAAAMAGPTDPPATWPGPARPPTAEPGHPQVVRVLPGPADHHAPAALDALVERSWTVDPASDRTGLRLRTGSDGTGAAGLEPDAGGLLSHGVVWGAVQLPPDGQPIVLLADHQTTGGYPVIAVAISADRPILGQLAPGETLGFVVVDAAGARDALRRQRAELADATAALRSSVAWDALWRSAGG